MSDGVYNIHSEYRQVESEQDLLKVQKDYYAAHFHKMLI
jgi:6-phosphogluconate dehydrogenase